MTSFFSFLILNYFKRPKSARIATFLSAIVGTCAYLSAHPAHTHETTPIYMLNLFPFVVFELKERRLYLFSYIAVLLICQIYLNGTFNAGVLGVLKQNIPQAPGQDYINLIGGMLATGVIAFYFVRQNYASENRLEAANKELAHTLEELKTTQEQLIIAEKQAALSKLVTGIAHEVNTPLGAIEATAVNHIDYLKQAIDWASQVFPQLPAEYLPQFLGLVHCIATQHTVLGSREERARQKQIAIELNAMNIPEANTLARRLASMGFEGTLNPYIDLIQHPVFGTDAMDAALYFGHLYYDVTIIRTSVKRTEKVVQTLKLYSSLQPPENAPRINIAHSLHTALNAYKQFWVKDLVLHTQIENDCWVKAYPEELTIVWQNILFNAIQATQLKGNINIKLYQNDGMVYCSIQDNGSGITPDIAHKVFEPFFTTKGEGEGIGLGLDISLRIIDKQKGKIQLSAQPNDTIFTVVLPAA